jgi:hypothetical protein
MNDFREQTEPFPVKMEEMMTMKKIVSTALALVLLMTCFCAFAEEGKSRTQFWIPKDLAAMEVEELPVSSFPAVKTKTANGQIHVSVSPEPDTLYANWLGYGEAPETVELTDGQGVISQQGHKYQLGARYVNSWWMNWIDGMNYAMYGETHSYEDAVAYFAENDAEEIADGARIINEPLKGYYVYYTEDSFYFENEEDPATYHQIGDYVLEQVGNLYATYEEATAAAEALGAIEYTEEKSEEYHATVYSVKGHGVENEGGYAWLGTVEYGHSRGLPNRAYTLLTGEYAVDYTRSGVPNYASRTTAGKDYFETGIEGATSVVSWEIGRKKNRILSIRTTYPEGNDIASISLTYPQRGNFYHYTVTYNAGEGEMYVATYSAKDELIKAYYVKDGNVVAANSSATRWINCSTGRQEHALEPLDGALLGHPAHVTAK